MLKSRIGAVVVMGIAVGCAPGAPGDGKRIGGTGIWNGQLDEGDPAVVAVMLGSHDSACTGTLIAPRVVLTAAHCVVDGAGPAKHSPYPDQFEVYFGADFQSGAGTFYAVASISVDPLYPGWNSGHDLALLELVDAATVTPIALNRIPIDADRESTRMRAVGFGQTDSGAGEDGKKRATTLTLSNITPEKFDGLPLPGSICHGDSGGPVLIDLGDGEVDGGVLSEFVVNDDPHCHKGGRYDSVAAMLDFIDPFLAAHQGSRTQNPFDCGDVTWAGTCDGDVLRYCTEDGNLQKADCAAQNLICGQTPEGDMNCVARDSRCERLENKNLCTADQRAIEFCSSAGRYSTAQCESWEVCHEENDDGTFTVCAQDTTSWGESSPCNGHPNRQDFCFGNIVVWCGEGSNLLVTQRDCAADGHRCELLPDGTYGCSEGISAGTGDPRCSDLGPTGRCDSDVREWCEAGVYHRDDCAERGQVCELYGSFVCVAPECVGRENENVGCDEENQLMICDAGQLRRWDCANESGTCEFRDDRWQCVL